MQSCQAASILLDCRGLYDTDLKRHQIALLKWALRNTLYSAVKVNFPFRQIASAETLLAEGAQILDVYLWLYIKYASSRLALSLGHGRILSKKVEDYFV